MDNRAEDIEKTDNFKLEIYFLFIIPNVIIIIETIIIRSYIKRYF